MQINIHIVFKKNEINIIQILKDTALLNTVLKTHNQSINQIYQ